MENVVNSNQGWKLLYRRYLKDGCTEKELHVKIEAGPDPSSDVTNLRYVFPLAVWMAERGLICAEAPLTVKVTLEEDKSDSLWRANAFLSNAGRHQYIRFDINGKPLKEQNQEQQAQNIGRIFPLCQVSLNAIPEENSAGYLELRKNPQAEKTPGERLTDGIGSIAQFYDTMLQYIRSDSSYEGTAGHRISGSEKRRLKQEVLKELDDWRGEMDLLSQIIWIFLLRELIKTKQLYRVSQGDNKTYILENVLTKSRMDAVSYGEAIYQLIENACLHSSGQRAWFGFRMHRAGRNVAMNALMKEAETRTRLYEKYKLCFTNYDAEKDKKSLKTANIFSGESRFFFEFFVMDSAIDQTGMTDRYNDEHITQVIKKKYQELLRKKKISLPGGEVDEELRKKAEEQVNVPKSAGLIDDLLLIEPREAPIEDYIEDVTVHYGLRLLRRIISINDGYLMAQTPAKAGGSLNYYNGAPLPERRSRDAAYLTEWMALLPITFQWSSMDNGTERYLDGHNLFEQEVSPPRKQIIYADCDKLLDTLDRALDKQSAIDELREKISEYVPWNRNDRLSSTIVLLKLDSPQLYDLELLAKALFACIARANYESQKAARRPLSLRLAVLLSTAGTLHELLRFFSSFYIKGVQADMEDVQVAFCSRGRESNLPRVNFVLAGPSLASAFEAAKIFAYHHSEDALNHLPLLDYLTKAEDGGTAAVPPLYPFDLFLPAQLPQGEQAALDIQPWKDSWFLQHMQNRLNRDIRLPGGGCMIDGVHVRLGSKIHLGRFYEGELLFHDAGNVMRFAYLLAQRLLYGEDNLDRDRHIILLGYEKYSVSLMLQVEYWLKRSNQFTDVHTAIIYDDLENGNVELRPCYDRDEQYPAVGTRIVAVVPVGTTLSTVYKMYHVARKGLAAHNLPWDTLYGNPSYTRNYCLILVNKDLSSELTSDVTKRYWSNINPASQTVTTRQEANGGCTLDVKYLIPAESEWFAPDSCSICGMDSNGVPAVIGAKHSDTTPNAIFTLQAKREGKFKNLVPDMGKNRDRIFNLFNTIHYSHLYHGNSHFQFLLDFPKLYYTHRCDIEKEVRTWQVPTDAFHVVISPLQFTNSPFLKAVLDLVFHGSARFLHIDLKDSYREDIRTKFVYITEEFRNLRRVAPQTRFCVHFVDTSIVTGSTVNRAKLLMQMLLTQSQCLDDGVELFSKVFLLVNRCSYSTVRSFVRDPRNDMRAYVHLAIPSYNTENDFCPACRLVKKYELLEKRSSTERLSSEFRRLKEKHKKRAQDEYDLWLNKTILNNPSYFSWLKQWLYSNVPEGSGQMISYAPAEDDGSRAVLYDCARTIARAIDEYIADRLKHQERDARHRQSTLELLSQICLNDIVDYVRSEGRAVLGEKQDADAFKRDTLRLVRTHLVETRNYMRLYAMQCAYEGLETLDESLSAGDGNDVLNRLTRKKMLELIAERLKDPIRKEMGKQLSSGFSDEDARRVEFCYKIEWFFSYIKVLSREQIAKYYHCRRAIMGIMGDMLRLLSIGNEKPGVRNKGHRLEQLSRKLLEEGEEWEPVISLFKQLRGTTDGVDGQLCALMEYQVMMMLLHRTADLQMNYVTQEDNIDSFMHRYYQLADRGFASNGPDGKEEIPVFWLPPCDKVIRRYLKSLKLAVMMNKDDASCLAMTQVPNALAHICERMDGRDPDFDRREIWLLFARYIYLENAQMLYAGMENLEKKLSAKDLESLDEARPVDDFGTHMRTLSGKAAECLSGCYQNLDSHAKEEDILYQNILGNFCRFWHQSTNQPPVTVERSGTGTMSADRIAHLLQYFRRLNKLSEETDRDELPYIYEELCRIICGFTGFQMCYIAFRGESKFPQIFTQSGYYVKFMRSSKILNAARLDGLLGRVDEARKRSDAALKGECPLPAESGDRMLIPGVTQLHDKNGDQDDYLIVCIGIEDDPLGADKFYIVLQADRSKGVFGTEEKLCIASMQNARDILFMRHQLQKALSRDYTMLISLRFDWSYVRPIRAEQARSPVLLHISDLHIKEDVTLGDNSKADLVVKKLTENMKEWGSERIDLLAITGDIIDGRDSNAPQIEENYRSAEKLLNVIVIHLWQDQDGYLPHDWRRRVMITTGNHDYAAMNQFQAILKRRVLTSGMPVEIESGTMSKFAYYIDFLIRYLDPPIDELIRNDLNEIRYYRLLNMKVLLLNCSGNAAPRRTNKIGVNREKVKALIERGLWAEDNMTDFRVCLAHYAYTYELSYFIDDYDTLPGWEWDPDTQKTCVINNLVAAFCESVLKEFRSRYVLRADHGIGIPDCTEPKGKDISEFFRDEFRAMEEALDVMQAGKSASGPEVDKYCKRLMPKVCGKSDAEKKKAALAAAKRVVEKMRQNELYRQIRSYYNWLCKSGCPNQEQISQLFYDVEESLTMSRFDKDCFKKIIDSAKRKDLYLAGHIHAYAENKTEHILVANKLFSDESDDICGYIVKMKEDTTQPRYDHKRLF